MPRPCKTRNIELSLKASYFKPRGIPLVELEEVVLDADEIEAIRLADLDGLYQEEAAARMGISRATFSNIITRAHGKAAEALLKGKALRINFPEVDARRTS